jgi:hypothetical protein
MSSPVPARSPLDVGALIALATVGLAGVLGLIAVIDADHVVSAFGLGIGVASLIFLSGATIACALACLKRGRVEILALAGIAAAGLATDLFVLAIWKEIDSEAYGKVAGISFVWSLYALIVLGLTLAVGPAQTALARSLYLAAAAATVVAGAVSTWLIATAGDGGLVPEGAGPASVPASLIGDDDLLRLLGAALVLLAALWFGTLAASRLQRPATSEA